MNKKLIIGTAVGIAALAAIAAAKKDSAVSAAKPTMWDKMREGFEQMPEDFPPRIMFDNIAVIRANSERIVELLAKGRMPHDARELTEDIEVIPAN